MCHKYSGLYFHVFIEETVALLRSLLAVNQITRYCATQLKGSTKTKSHKDKRTLHDILLYHT